MFFGTDAFSVKTLEALHHEQRSSTNTISHLSVCHLRMRKLVSEVKKFSLANGIELVEWPPGPNLIAGGGYDLGIVASFGKLIPERLIQSFPRGVLNVHGSILPRWRGASPVAHAIMNGDTETGISIMEIEPHHFDRGGILATASYTIGPDALRSDVADDLASIGARVLIGVLKDLDRIRERKATQQDDGVTYAPLITTEHFRVDFSCQTAEHIYNQYRALDGLGKLFATWKQSGISVRFSDMLHPNVVAQLCLDERYPDAIAADAVVARGSGGEKLVCIKGSAGWVSFAKFYYGNKKAMTAAEFSSGFIKNKQHTSFAQESGSGCD